MEETAKLPPEASRNRPRSAGRFPAKDVDWEAVRREYCDNCVPAKDVAAKYGLRVNHIYQRAHRQKWPTPLNQVQATASKAVKAAISKRVGDAVARAEPAIAKAVQEWQERTLKHAGKSIDKVGTALEGNLELEELKTAVSVLDVADRVGRRALGLDRDASSASVDSRSGFSLTVRLETLATQATEAGPVIDVTPERLGDGHDRGE